MKQQPLAEYVHHLPDCPTREIKRGDEGCTCGAPKVIADIELAYGLLWCILGTDERTHRARMLLAKAIGREGMKRGLRAVPTEDRPSDRQMIELFLQGEDPSQAPEERRGRV